MPSQKYKHSGRKREKEIECSLTNTLVIFSFCWLREWYNKQHQRKKEGRINSFFACILLGRCWSGPQPILGAMYVRINHREHNWIVHIINPRPYKTYRCWSPPARMPLGEWELTLDMLLLFHQEILQGCSRMNLHFLKRKLVIKKHWTLLHITTKWFV